MKIKSLTFGFSNHITKEELEKAYSEGMIKKSNLVNEAHYLGTCRNSYVAKWISKDNCFYYMRTKFGDTFIESIKHPEDDDRFDFFIPMEKIEDIYE